MELAAASEMSLGYRVPEASPSEYSALMHVKPPQPDRDIRRSPRSPCRRDG